MLAAQRKRHDSTEADTTTGADPDHPARASTAASSIAGGVSASTTELRLTPRTLQLPEPSAVVQAYLQYAYTLALCTPLQGQVSVLCALLIFARTYGDEQLRVLAVHALHGELAEKPSCAGAVYEAATLAGAKGLQIRALRTMLVSLLFSRHRHPAPTTRLTTPSFNMQYNNPHPSSKPKALALEGTGPGKQAVASSVA